MFFSLRNEFLSFINDFTVINGTFLPKTFKQNLYQTKTRNISITIDLEEKLVEKFYLYDQNKKQEIIKIN